MIHQHRAGILPACRVNRREEQAKRKLSLVSYLSFLSLEHHASSYLARQKALRNIRKNMLRKPLSNAQNDELHFLWRGDRTTGNFSSVSGERAIILNRSPSLCVREMQDMLGSQTHHAIMIA